MSQRVPQNIGPPPLRPGPPLNRRPLNRRRYVAGHRQNFQPPQSPVTTPQDRNVQWADTENYQIPVGYQEDVSGPVPLTEVELERVRPPVLPAARRPSSDHRIYSNTYDLGYSDEESDIRVRSDSISNPDVGANWRERREHAHISVDGGSDDGQITIEGTVASLDIAPLLQSIVETNNFLYDYLLRAANVRQNKARRLSPVQSMSWSGSSVDLERGTVPESHERPHPRYTHPPFSHDAVESNVAEFPISEANSAVPFATSNVYSSADSAQPVSQTQSLVLYGTYLSPRNTPSPSIRSRNSTSTRSTRSTRSTKSTRGSGNIGGYWYFGFPYTDPLKTLEFATDAEIESDQEARRNLINPELFTQHEFSDLRHILRLYPLRYNILQAIRDDLIDVHNLAELCVEVRATLQGVVLDDWESIPAFLPLIEERLLCCTGDPTLRLGACWDRRPRGTFLDFGWTRGDPQMPLAWSFFAHCSPETLISILIEITEAVKDQALALQKEYHYNSEAQAWKTVTIGSILRGCYMRRLLVQLEPNDTKKYEKHVLYLLAAIELTNTFFKSERTELNALDDIVEIGHLTAQALVALPLSNIAMQVLGPGPTLRSRHRMAGHEVFPPKHLNIELLMGLGFLKIEWTEYLHEHLTFDSTTMTVYIYWFASHIFGNSSFHLYCQLFGCENPHRPVRGGQSQTSDLSYRRQVTDSYRWIFNEITVGSPNIERYYDLPLPWWLAPLDQPAGDTTRPGWRNTSLQPQNSKSKTTLDSSLKKLFEYAVSKFHLKPASKTGRPTIRTLLKDSQGHKCDLPIDCLTQLDLLDNQSERYGNDDDDNEGISKTLAYNRYPDLAPRIKLLVDYMEKQKPRGFRALWRDKRDSSAWYTFWAAVIFGAVALLLALTSLAVSAAQTWASFRALKLQNS